MQPQQPQVPQPPYQPYQPPYQPPAQPGQPGQPPVYGPAPAPQPLAGGGYGLPPAAQPLSVDQAITAAGGQQPNYDFIVNADHRKPRSVGAPTSLVGRVAVVAGALVVLIIGFAIVKSLLSGGGNGSAMLTVTQDQQEIIHLATAAAQQQSISSTNKNSAVTASLVLTSEQSQLLSYLHTQHQKISDKQLNLKISSQIDAQLTTAQAASTYDQTLKDVMQAQLQQYAGALKTAYQKTPGPKGRKLLTDEYNSATLLLQQLSAASN